MSDFMNRDDFPDVPSFLRRVGTAVPLPVAKETPREPVRKLGKALPHYFVYLHGVRGYGDGEHLLLLVDVGRKWVVFLELSRLKRLRLPKTVMDRARETEIEGGDRGARERLRARMEDFERRARPFNKRFVKLALRGRKEGA